MRRVRRVGEAAASRLLGSVAATRRIAVQGQDVVLTYDDGPDATQTPLVLDALAEHSATATFFLLLTRARRHPSIVRELVDRGHEVALHGADHRPLTAYPATVVRRRIRDARVELEQIAEVPITRFRPPYGLLTLAASREVAAARMQTLLWNRETLDWLELPADRRVSNATDGIRAGDVLLAHDCHATREDGALDGDGPVLDRADLTRRILDRLSSAGLAGRSAAHATA